MSSTTKPTVIAREPSTFAHLPRKRLRLRQRTLAILDDAVQHADFHRPDTGGCPTAGCETNAGCRTAGCR